MLFSKHKTQHTQPLTSFGTSSESIVKAKNHACRAPSMVFMGLVISTSEILIELVKVSFQPQHPQKPSIYRWFICDHSHVPSIPSSLLLPSYPNHGCNMQNPPMPSDFQCIVYRDWNNLSFMFRLLHSIYVK